jgi:hypothetical protein
VLLIETEPTTTAGALALARYAAELEAREDYVWIEAGAIHRNVANALERLAARA